MDILQRLFKSVSGKTRIDILLLLLNEGELSVGEIAAKLNRKIPVISRNLSILEKDNFIKARHISNYAFYSIKEESKYKYNHAILEILRQRLIEIRRR